MNTGSRQLERLAQIYTYEGMAGLKYHIKKVFGTRRDVFTPGKCRALARAAVRVAKIREGRYDEQELLAPEANCTF